MVIVIFGEHGNGKIYIMTWFAFVCFDIIVSLGLSLKLAIWEHIFCCQKPIEWCDTWFRLPLTNLGQIDLCSLTRSGLKCLL